MNRTITINGFGKLTLKPDQTAISLTLKTVDKGYDNAVGTAAAHLEQLRAALADVGFARNDLKTADFSIGTEYENERDTKGNYKRVFVGYRVTHRLKLEFDFDSTRLSETLAAVSACIAEPELDIQFTVKDKDAVSAALLESACADARAKAEILAAASGVTLGGLISIEYNRSDPNLISPTRYGTESACMMKAAAPGIEIVPDDITVCDSAAFVWEIV